ncbi:MAG: DUF2269 family protein [Pseudomonadota bacterium]
MLARKSLKVLHSIAAAGLIGGLACYMILLVATPQLTPEAYAELRQSIQLISRYVIVPSMAIALVSGLLSMLAHPPFLDKGWVWIKAATGILMFKGVLTIDSAKAAYAATVSERIASGEAPPDALDQLLSLEWNTLLAVMAIAIANVVLGIWRPRRLTPASPPASEAPSRAAPGMASTAAKDV